MNELENKIKELFININELTISVEKIDINENLSVYGMNSINFIKLAVSLETEFGFEFSDDHLDYNKFSNIKSLICYVESQIDI